MQDAPNPTEFYDDLVTSIEAGDSEFALARLVGVLDALTAASVDMGQWRAELLSHRLGEMIGCRPVTDEGQPLQICLEEAEIPAANVLPSSALGHARVTRQSMAANAIKRALGQNKSVLALDQASWKAAQRSGSAEHAKAKVGQINQDGAISAPNERFDLIVAIQIISRCPADLLAARLTQLASYLAPGGSMLLSSFLPFHMGSGWRLLCSDDESQMHNEASLSAAADEANIELSTFRDSQNTLLWAVARLRDSSNTLEGY